MSRRATSGLGGRKENVPGEDFELFPLGEQKLFQPRLWLVLLEEGWERSGTLNRGAFFQQFAGEAL